MPELKGNEPPFQQIVDYFRDRILSGGIKPKEKIPSLNTISSEWGVSKTTAEKAIAALRADGLVRGIQGIGTEVADARVPLSSGKDRLARSRRTGSLSRSGETSGGHEAGMVEAPQHVADALGIEPGEQVIRRSRVFSDRNGIVALSTSWLPDRFAERSPELLRPEPLGRTSIEVVEEATGRRATSRITRVKAREATAEEQQRFGGEGAAVLVVKSLFVDADGTALEYGVDVGAPDRELSEETDLSE